LDCDDTDALVHPGATEYCDGQYNNCSDLTYNADAAPTNESDVDQDGYVACGFTNGVPWARANVPTDDGDCEDTDATVYPTAIEVCDGQYNNCSTFGYSLNGAPANETDNDGDGYVDCPSGQYLDTNGCMCASVSDSNGDGIPDVFNSCSNATGSVCTPDAGSISAVVWAGRNPIAGYADCQDANVRMYPGAPESCDGIFNNCNHPQKSAYHGVVSDCFCPTLDTNGDGTRDTCVASNCVDSAGAICSPVDEDNNGYVDPAFCYISTTPEVVNAQNYYGAEVDCYCPNDSCQIDVLSNGLSDCLTPRGETCIPTDSINVGFADNCVDGFTVSHTFTLGNGSALTRPFDEMDNDGDGYVECTYQPAIWLGSFSVVGGLDCDDYDDAVYPTAQEVCDGQYNNCLNNYVVNGAPANEVDNDGDGWVECARDSDVVWNAYNGVDMVNIRGYGTDGTINGTIECICSDSACSQDCTTPQGATCTVLPQYCAPHESYDDVDCDDTDFYAHPYLAYNESANIARALSIASCLRDRDGDGYGDSSPVNTAVTAGRDCDDLNQLVHPEQNEVCEVGTQVDSDCNGDVNTADYAAGYLLDTNGNGSLLYVDDDGDGFGDSRTAATPACEVAPGFVFNATDCNDDNANINPTAKEICDGVDQDCDLTIDEAESLDTPSISKCIYMYRDVDGDSYGDVDYAACLC